MWARTRDTRAEFGTNKKNEGRMLLGYSILL